MTVPSPKGVFSLLATPFEEDGRIDLFALDRLLERQQPSSGVAFGFPQGEGESLSLEEYRLLLEEIVLFCAGRKRVAAACFAQSTAGALKRGMMAREAGADLLFLPPPCGLSSLGGDYFRHLKALSCVGLPFVALLPSSGGEGGDLALPLEISRLPYFAGFAITGLDAPCWGLLHAACPELPLFIWKDALLAPALLSGFSGAFSSLSCLLPRQTALLVRECGKNSARASAIQSALFPLCAHLGGREGCALLKWGLHKQGLLTPTLRLPRALPSERLLADFERTLEQAEGRARRAMVL